VTFLPLTKPAPGRSVSRSSRSPSIWIRNAADEPLEAVFRGWIDKCCIFGEEVSRLVRAARFHGSGSLEFASRCRNRKLSMDLWTCESNSAPRPANGFPSFPSCEHSKPKLGGLSIFCGFGRSGIGNLSIKGCHGARRPVRITSMVRNSHRVPVEAAVLAGAICSVKLSPRSIGRGPFEQVGL